MEAPTFNLQSVNECSPRCTFACCFALVQAGPMEYFHHLPYLLYFPPQETVSFVHCAAGNPCNILALCSGMGCVGSWTLWSLWVPSKLRHSSCMGINLVLMHSQAVYLGMFEIIPLPDCFSVPPCKVLLLLQDVSQGELAAFWCNSQLGCSDTGATPCSPHCTSPAPAAPPEPQQMIHFCLEAGWTTRAWQRNLSAHSSYIPRVNADFV